ncbi:molybdopterin-guanine dinucleotide biosynthesis protein B [Paenibacillus sp. GYB003]|jgi:molybdopterin-guanine dinucleotide biosynthesis protein B|uniref:molybdopterin-guanine dinucleotide biosynthesis protein B n=1 Tax=Paenibacillus sp. GYB003 TaxID=2994392 RepID=UPI002F960BE7
MNGRTTPIIGFAGYSDSGKTTLAVHAVRSLRRSGWKVAVIKHDGHDHYREPEGTDSGRYAEAGADAVVVVSRGRTVKIERTEPDAGLAEAASGLTGYDLIVVEGFKAEPHPKIVVFRDERQAEALERAGPNVVAYATTDRMRTLRAYPNPDGVSVLNVDEPDEVVDFIVRFCRLFRSG